MHPSTVRRLIASFRRIPLSRRVLVGVSALALAAGVALLWPTTLGGWTGYVTVHGTSMEPRLRTGDLVLVRKSPSYHVGEVVAFRLWGGEVIHRLHSGSDATGFTTKGDNRTSPDPWTVQPGDIIGRKWVVIPKLGYIVADVHGPVGALVIFLVLTALGARSVSALRTSDRRRRNIRKELPLPSSILGTRPSRRALVAVGLLALTAAASGALTAAAFRTPLTRSSAPVVTGPSQQVSYRYTVRSRPSALNERGVTTVSSSKRRGGAKGRGDLYSSLVRTMSFVTSWSLQPPFSGQVSGTYSARAVISAPGGWSKTVRLTQTRSFTGSTLRFTVPVNLAALLGLISKIEGETEYGGGNPQIEIVPTIDSSVGSGRAHKRYVMASPFTMALNGTLIEPPDSLVRTTTPPTTTRTLAGRLVIGSIALPDRQTRLWALLGLVLSAYALFLVWLRLGRSWDVAIARRVRSRYGVAFVHVGEGPGLETSSIRASSFEDLARVAGCNDGVINVWQGAGGCHFYVRTAHSGTYILVEPDAVVEARVRRAERPALPKRADVIAAN